MRLFKVLLVAILMVVVSDPSSAATKQLTFRADVWADNWFALYVNGLKVAQDPVPVTTTKSFNKVSVTFKASYPLTIAITAKDYVENSSGLEYIGSPQQQIGDGGLIAQIHETVSGKLAAATDSTWKVLPIFKAPLNPDCVTSLQPLADCRSQLLKTPSKWASASYSTAKWSKARTYTPAEVGVKGGFEEVSWDPSAKLIWSESLTVDNTVLFRYTSKKALTPAPFTISSPDLLNGYSLDPKHTCDGEGRLPTLVWRGVPAGSKTLVLAMESIPGPARPGEIVQTDFTHLIQYNIPATVLTIGASLAAGESGKNFKGSNGYAPPCSQGPGEKSYTFVLYALSSEIDGNGLTHAEVMNKATGSLLATTELTVRYSRG